MKRILLFASLFMTCIMALPIEKTTVIKNILGEYVIWKVDYMQQLIKFTDSQANQLKHLELNYLLDVQKAENCKCCNSKKKVAKLTEHKDKELQEILTREQYLKYDALERDKIKKYPLWSE